MTERETHHEADVNNNKQLRSEYKRYWDELFGKDDIRQIESKLPKVLEYIDSTDKLSDYEYFRKGLKKSFKLRYRARQRQEFAKTLKETENPWHVSWKKIKEVKPKARDVDIAAQILHIKKDESNVFSETERARAVENFLYTSSPEEIIRENKGNLRDIYRKVKGEGIVHEETVPTSSKVDKVRKPIRRIEVGRWVEAGLAATALFFLARAGWEKVKEDKIKESDLSRNSTPMLIYQAESTPTEELVVEKTTTPTETKVVVPTQEIFPTNTPEPPKTKNPYEISSLRLDKEFEVNIPEIGIGFVSNPLVNDNPGEWSENMINRFNAIENPNDVVIVPTDINGQLVVIGHSFTKEGQELPFEKFRLSDGSELIGKKLIVEQTINGKKKNVSMEITYVNTIDAKQYLNSDAKSADNQSIIFRSDLSINKNGEMVGLGLPDSERVRDSLVLVTCAGQFMDDESEKYAQRRILVAKILNEQEQPVINEHTNFFGISPEVLAADKYLSEVVYLMGKINEYNKTHPDGSPERVGDYLIKSGWFRLKSEEEKQKMASILSVLNNKTYAYIGPNGPESVQCIDAVSLLAATGHDNSPLNVGALSIESAADILESVDHKGLKIKGSVSDIGLKKLEPGDLVMFGPHFVAVVAKRYEGEIPVVTFAEVNRHKDGRAEVYEVDSPQELAIVFPPGAMVGR